MSKYYPFMNKNPYEMTYKEFVDFMNDLKKKAFSHKKPIKNNKIFTSKEEYMAYYGAISVDDYIKKSHGKY